MFSWQNVLSFVWAFSSKCSLTAASGTGFSPDRERILTVPLFDSSADAVSTRRERFKSSLLRPRLRPLPWRTTRPAALRGSWSVSDRCADCGVTDCIGTCWGPDSKFEIETLWLPSESKYSLTEIRGLSFDSLYKYGVYEFTHIRTSTYDGTDTHAYIKYLLGFSILDWLKLEWCLRYCSC